MTLETLLEEQGIPFERHVHRPTYTSQELADAEHVSGYMVAKPVVVRTARGFTMCVLPAPLRLDLRRTAESLGEEEVRLATEAEMAELFPSCELGAEPPVGALFGLETVMDASLREDEYLVMQAGTHSEAIKLRRADFEALCKPRIARLTSN